MNINKLTLQIGVNPEKKVLATQLDIKYKSIIGTEPDTPKHLVSEISEDNVQNRVFAVKNVALLHSKSGYFTLDDLNEWYMFQEDGSKLQGVMRCTVENHEGSPYELSYIEDSNDFSIPVVLEGADATLSPLKSRNAKTGRLNLTLIEDKK